MNIKNTSVWAAALLLGTLTITTGCGGGGSSSDDPVNSSSSTTQVSSSSASAQMSTVRVSDAYVLDASVSANGVSATQTGNGVYEFSTVVSGTITAVDGINDLDEDGNVSSGDSRAPGLAAPAGYANVNPFTSLVVLGMSNVDLANNYPAAYAHNSGSFDFDVVVAGQADLALAKETLKAAIALAMAEQAAATAPVLRECNDLIPDPNNPECAAGSTTSTATSTSSSSLSSSSSSDANASESSSSVSSDGSSSSDVSSTGASSSTTSAPLLPALSAEVEAAIDAAATYEDLASIAKTQFDAILGQIPPVQ
jgi:hypothetical protein